MSVLPDYLPETGAYPIAFPASLEEELSDVLHAAGLRGRQVRAVAARLGWSGRPATTLAAAAVQEGYTRERVRQLEARVVLHAAQVPLRLPLTAAALRLVHNAAPAGREQIARELARSGLAVNPFDVSGLFSAAELGRLELTVCERDGMIARTRQLELVRELEQAARRLVGKHGAAPVGALIERSTEQTTVQTARQLLDAHASVNWLDDRREWFSVRGASSPLARTLKKMLSLSVSLSLSDIDEGLRRAARPIALPVDVLLRLCDSLAWLAVGDGDPVIVTTLVPLDERQVLSPIEQALVSIFRREGPVLGFTSTLELGKRQGLNPNSLGLYLIRSPIIKRVERGRYRLRTHEALTHDIPAREPETRS